MATRTENKPDSSALGNSVADDYRRRAAACLDVANQVSLLADRAAMIAVEPMVLLVSTFRSTKTRSKSRTTTPLLES